MKREMSSSVALATGIDPTRPSVAEDCDIVADLHDFADLVGDEDDRIIFLVKEAVQRVRLSPVASKLRSAHLRSGASPRGAGL